MSGELASFEVDGYQLVYQDLGEGTPVLLVHGSLCDYRDPGNGSCAASASTTG
ncbi:hypothetical protein ACG3RN_17380 [Pseudomonas aeruginosa]